MEESLFEKPTIFVVDDTPDNLKLMSTLLRDRYKVKVANSGRKALAIAEGDHGLDLILLDVMMPEMDGYEVCRRLKADPNTRDVPIIFLTAKSQSADEEMGLRLGAVDYITKPFSPAVVMARVETHLKLKASADFLRDKAEFLEQEVARRTREVSVIQDVTIQALASLAETRDSDTGNHIRRTQHYVRILAERLQAIPAYAAQLDGPSITRLMKSAPLHDIGKVGIPDRILLKPGRFEPHEFEIMQKHAALGYTAIEQAEKTLGSPVAFLSCAKEIARSHHEKWDGSGYPDGLAGEDIPLCARLMALADVYDALVSRRVYKDGLAHEKAVEIIRSGRGGHFDPAVVDAFLAVQEQFRDIAARWADAEQGQAASAE